MLNKRLLAVSNNVIKGEAAADIGADHGLLTLFLLEKDIVPQVIASEVKEGPLERLRHAVENSPFRERMELRMGNGLEVLRPGEVATVIIAGMGGDNIAEILSREWSHSASYKKFVFQPMSKAEVLRRELSRQGWPVLEESLVKEQQRIFLIISACPGNAPYELTPLELDLGPIILKNDKPLKQHFLEDSLRKYRRVYQGLLRSKHIYSPARLEEYEQKIKALEEIIHANYS
ncbi:MAG: class I SAM-dependent methyltransferase [Syntrophomonas sp.]|uniref:tRNA (adenine(22)-N(1))-methyltransferase n=1 Tax=Syntrophomonas sp. TaxID=2053627 RepID=UPI00261D186E|nr:class I SAM-dependent methyltransferase [Syntrophomonas sp.]MDD4627174.1 class I SAM-dependent methyltransferase [Syntrophomonas sp.]